MRGSALRPIRPILLFHTIYLLYLYSDDIIDSLTNKDICRSSDLFDLFYYLMQPIYYICTAKDQEPNSPTLTRVPLSLQSICESIMLALYLATCFLITFQGLAPADVPFSLFLFLFCYYCCRCRNPLGVHNAFFELFTCAICSSVCCLYH